MKCTSCGLTNFATESACRRCGASLDVSAGTGPGTWQPMSTVQGWGSRPGAYDTPPAYGGAPPAYGAYVPVQQASGIWSDGDTLVVHRNAVLPDRCVKCNAPAGGDRVRRRFAWHHPALYLLILAGLLVYAIVALIVQKKAVLDLGICAEHRKRRRGLTIAAWALLGAAFVAIPVAVRMGSGLVALLAVLLFFAAAVAGYVVTNWIVTSKIDDSYVWLKKVDRAYLSSFPPAR